jgi:hypothetical protein
MPSRTSVTIGNVRKTPPFLLGGLGIATNLNDMDTYACWSVLWKMREVGLVAAQIAFFGKLPMK